MITQATTETELSRITWDDPIILDCLNPILYQLPVWRNGFHKSLPSSFLSLKLILNLQSTTQVFVKMLKDGVFRTVGVLNAEIYQIIHPKIHSIISFPPSLLDSSLFISYLQLLAVSSVYATAIFFIRIVLGFFFSNVDLFGLGCFFVNFWAKERDLLVIFGFILLIGIIVIAA